MKNTILTVMLLGLVTGVGFAQHGRTGGSRATALGEPPTLTGPIVVSTAPIAGKPGVTMEQVAGTMAPATTTSSKAGGVAKAGGVLPPNIHNPQVPPNLLVGPNVGPQRQRQR